jgi:hypothetical protein
MRGYDRAGLCRLRFGGRLVLGGARHELGQLQLEPVDEPLAPLAGLAELLAPRFGEQQPQALDLERGGGDQGLGLKPGAALGHDHRVRRGEIRREGYGLIPHRPDASTIPTILEVKRPTNKK